MLSSLSDEGCSDLSVKGIFFISVMYELKCQFPIFNFQSNKLIKKDNLRYSNQNYRQTLPINVIEPHSTVHIVNS